ncbi:leucine-rich repeat flightless-interacting protein 2-like isoform X2 [Limulus polyphemus]|uniref:Leucine-rich repeat flightless-interacting protein 2-like isoform X2 n=1 Tax=Limulus polyphemus TaxID=6850 RepID=A0ABM1AZT5_LIMPO|nr:leucine-rich repeat flightless-interacting protein 2-like isoform X2 [Limulus polyphemus]
MQSVWNIYSSLWEFAEARLAARRQARAEAREIRMRELQKQQQEADQQSDKYYDLPSDPVRGRPGREGRSSSFISSTYSYTSSRRSSEDSTDAVDNSRELRHQLQDIEEKFKKAMVSNAQLDNEKSSLSYNVETLKDEIEELEENLAQIRKDYKEKSRAYDQLTRDSKEVKEEIVFLKESLRRRDDLIEQHGLILVGGEETVMNGDDNCSSSRSTPDSSAQKTENKSILVSQEVAHLLGNTGEGSLDLLLKQFAEERVELVDKIHRLKLDLEEEKQKTAKLEQLTLVHDPQSNGPETNLLEVQREVNKQVSDYKFKLKKAEQENSTLQSSVSRLESQVIRYKTEAENAEKLEDELKAEKRKLQREVREAQTRIEELETANAHLQKRMDKLKSTRNAITK